MATTPSSPTPRSPMPSRPSMAPPPVPQGAKPVALTPESMMERVRRGKGSHGVLLPLLFSLLILLLLIGAGIGYLFIASGTVRPTWAKVMYRAPAPTRVITNVAVVEPAIFEKNLSDQLLHEAAAHPTSTVQRVTVTEKELTGLLEGASGWLAKNGVELKRSQVVILRDHVELYAEISRKNRTLDVLATFIPHVASSTLSVEWTGASVGALSVSPAFAQSLIGKYSSPALSGIHATFGKYALKSIALADGQAILEFEKR